MIAHDFLTLRIVRLAPEESWSFKQDGWCVVAIKSGSGNYYFGTAQNDLGPGDVLVVRHPAVVQLQPIGATELLLSCFHFRLDHLYPLFAGTEISLLEGVEGALQRPRHLPHSLTLARQCHRLLDEVTPRSNLDHRSQLLRVVALLLTEEFQKAQTQRAGPASMEDHLLQTFERLSADELLNISVGELASKFNCSRRHLNRLFHQYFGFSVASLRMEMRLLKAVSLLRDANAKVINVAEQCGFNHLGLFNTCFKRRFGVSPGQWRKQGLRVESYHPGAAPGAGCGEGGKTGEGANGHSFKVMPPRSGEVLPAQSDAKISVVALNALSQSVRNKMTL